MCKETEKTSPSARRRLIQNYIAELSRICAAGKGVELIGVNSRQAARRTFNFDGHVEHLDPGLFAVTLCDGCADRWFIEADTGEDRDVEKIIEECHSYREYYYSGGESEYDADFPLVVWIAPDKQRRDELRQYIRRYVPPRPKIFLVIAAEELEALVRQEIGQEEIC